MSLNLNNHKGYENNLLNQTNDRFIQIGKDASLLIFNYLDVNDLLNLSLCCNNLLDCSKNEQLWKNLLYNDFGLINISSPPSSENDIFQIHTYKECYVKWRISFSEYKVEEVKLAIIWWNRMEKYLLINAPSIYNTLRKPAKKMDFEQYELSLGQKFPSLLKLLYRFHDGQNIYYDKLTLEEKNIESLRNNNNNIPTRYEIQSSKTDGIFGGYTYYSDCINMRFLPLKTSLKLSQELLYNKDNNILNKSKHPHEIKSSNTDLNINSFSKCRKNKYECVIFASSALEEGGISKIFLAGDKGQQYNDGVFVNTGNFENMIPVVSPLISSNLNAVGGTLFLWLEEYLKRLENQEYIVQPLDLTNPSKKVHKFKSISLFPTATTSLSSSKQKTLGVEISCSSIFVPEKSFPSHQLFWTYSIGMRLLKNCPNRPYNLNSVKLLRRHWIIDKSDGHCETVNGDGVIGLFPELNIEESQNIEKGEWPFAYQSCVSDVSFPLQMSGSIEFTAPKGILDMNNPEVYSAVSKASNFENDGNEDVDIFCADIGSFEVSVPDFIY